MRGWNQRCTPPLERHELARTVKSAYRNAKGAPGAATPSVLFAGVHIEAPEPVAGHIPDGEVLTEHSVAELFVERHRENLRFDHTSGHWHEWKDGIWRMEWDPQGAR